MNIRQVLKAFTALRQLTDDESALLETLRKTTDAERELLVETLAPQKSSAKRAGKKSASKTNILLCGACGYAESSIVHKDESRSNFHLFYPPSKSTSKSSRASGMAAAIAKSPSHGKPTGEGPICKICSYAEDYEDHSQPSPHYHPFEPSGSTASRAGAKSSTNGGATATIASSEDETVSAGVAAGGLNE